MELWIRSQDRKSLKKVCDLSEHFGNAKYGVYEDVLPLGYYETEERALEVLDEIVDLMLPVKEGLDENGEYSCKGCFANKDMMYYEMPLE